MDNLSAAAIIDMIPIRIDYEKASGRSLTLVYQLIALDGVKSYKTVRLSQGICTVSGELPQEYDAKLSVREEDYLRIVTGRMDYELARWNGIMRFFGNNLVHRELNTYIKPPYEIGVFMM